MCGAQRQRVREVPGLQVRDHELIAAGLLAREDRLAIGQPHVEPGGARERDVAVDLGGDAPVAQAAARELGLEQLEMVRDDGAVRPP